MAFSTNLDNYAYSADPHQCADCCDVGKTPENIFLCFAEIQIGDLWIPADPPPPYGCYPLTHDGFCVWGDITPDYFLGYESKVGNVALTVFGPVFQSIFLNHAKPPCSNWFDNVLVNPAVEKYYGGYCVVINTLPGGFPDITDLLKLMSDSPDWADWLGSVGLAANTASYQFSKHLDHTNVRILMDVP